MRSGAIGVIPVRARKTKNTPCGCFFVLYPTRDIDIQAKHFLMKRPCARHPLPGFRKSSKFGAFSLSYRRQGKATFAVGPKWDHGRSKINDRQFENS
jgi:hypothetical protein